MLGNKIVGFFTPHLMSTPCGVCFLVSAYIVFLLSGPFSAESAELFKIKFPVGLEEVESKVPSDNPVSREKVNLGWYLFFDKRLSRNDSISCATCHNPVFAFTDRKSVSSGIGKLNGKRNAPTLINRVFSQRQFWDGRAASLEEQVAGPLLNPLEQGFENEGEITKKLNRIPEYRAEFKRVFGTEVTLTGIKMAIASFERTILSGNSRFDQYQIEGKESALSESAKRGLKLFNEKARCVNCHLGSNFTDEDYHNLGIGWDTDKPDLGRYDVTKNDKDKGAFKTPTLREIEHTPPYMHDGRFWSLEEVVLFYDQGGIKNPYLDSFIVPLNLTEEERRDLVAFLKSLNGEGWQQIHEPSHYPN